MTHIILLSHFSHNFLLLVCISGTFAPPVLAVCSNGGGCRFGVHIGMSVPWTWSCCICFCKGLIWCCSSSTGDTKGGSLLSGDPSPCFIWPMSPRAWIGNDRGASSGVEGSLSASAPLMLFRFEATELALCSAWWEGRPPSTSYDTDDRCSSRS